MGTNASGGNEVLVTRRDDRPSGHLMNQWMDLVTFHVQSLKFGDSEDKHSYFNHDNGQENLLSIYGFIVTKEDDPRPPDQTLVVVIFLSGSLRGWL